MSQPATAKTGREASEGGRQYLSFELCNERYAVDIDRVQEVRQWTPATVMPGFPEYFRGVWNLRGNIVPIIDLRLRLGLEARDYDTRTVVVVVSAGPETSGKQFGLAVDAVSEVLTINGADLRKHSGAANDEETRCVRDVAMIEDRLVMLLETDRLEDTALAWGDRLAQEAGAVVS